MGGGKQGAPDCEGPPVGTLRAPVLTLLEPYSETLFGSNDPELVEGWFWGSVDADSEYAVRSTVCQGKNGYSRCPYSLSGTD